MKCDEAAQHAVDGLIKRAKDRGSGQLPDDVRAAIAERTQQLEQLAPRLRAVITNRCVDDKWPADVIACYAAVTSMDELRTCRGKLPAEPQAKVQKEELDLFAGALGPPSFGSAGPLTSADVECYAAEARQLNTQLRDATTKLAAAQNEAEQRAAQAEVLRLQQALTAANQALEQARTAATLNHAP